MDISDNASIVWNNLGQDYATKGKAADSLDLLVEYPAQLKAVGDYKGKSILDLGCGAGEKAFHFANTGAAEVFAIDISENFTQSAAKNFSAENLKFITGNLRNIDTIAELAGKTFDIITCFQAISYSDDLKLTFLAVAKHLKPSGKFILTLSNPLRFAVEKSERHGMPIGKAYMEGGLYSYPAIWNPQLRVQHYLYRPSDILNALADSNLHVLRCEEPDLDKEKREKYPHKAAWMDKYGGIMIYQIGHA